MKYCICVFLITCCNYLFAQVSPFIQVDQFGYITGAEKVAVLSNPVVGFNSSLSYSAPPTLEVRNSTTNVVAFTGPVVLWNNGNTHTESGDKGWWFDFSDLKTDGSYYVFDVANNQRSAVFEISSNPYGNVLAAAFKMFYYNRCNLEKKAPYAQTKWTDGTNFLNPLQDANCRLITSPGNAALEKDLSGGWFDAGDYNKYVSFTNSPLHDLLSAYEENPTLFTDNFIIPESNNNIPDLLDEVKWELDWLFKMTETNGSVHIKVGSKNYSENISSPPSVNTDQRYYGPTCTSASATIASVFSHAAIVMSNFPILSAYSDQLLNKAITCFNYVLPFYNNSTLETECDNGSIIAGDADVSAAAQLDLLVTAAVYLFEKTGNNTYNQFIIDHYAQTIVMTSGYWGVDASELQDALLRYSKLTNANTTVKNAITTAATTTVTNNWNGLFGWNTSDLYRAFMPTWSYGWGSNMLKADYGSLNLSMSRKNIGNASSLKRKAAEQLHYFHGVNPLGKVYLSNMYQYGGENCVNEIYHTWFNDNTVYDNALTSPKGPAPGYLAGGPNSTFSVGSITPPSGQPLQKSFLDFNTGWPQNSWEITEPAIYYQAAYIRLLANYALPVNGDPLPVTLYDFHVKEICCNKAELHWKTASETNNDHFEIERSENGFDFKQIGQIEGKGTTNDPKSYLFTDSELIQSTYYYRLRQVDTDGQSAYSNIISLIKTPEKAVTISPNPFREYLEVNYPDYSKPATVTIRDVAGRLILKRMINAPVKFETAKFATGVYILSVDQDNDKTFSQKILKN
jgi:endoglucanase